jgi:hypothetical protein
MNNNNNKKQEKTMKRKEVKNEEYFSERSDSFTLPNGKIINRGDAVAVAGVSGTWRLSYVYKNQPVLYGGDLGYGELRSFAVDRLGVPRKKFTRNYTDEQRAEMSKRMAEVRARRTKASA